VAAPLAGCVEEENDWVVGRAELIMGPPASTWNTLGPCLRAVQLHLLWMFPDFPWLPSLLDALF
jgi:hypothetical protein